MGQNQLILRALEPQDIDAIYRWENDPEIWQYSDVHTPFSRHALTQYLMDSSTGDFYRDRQLRLIAEVGGQAVGCVDLFDYDPSHHRAGIGILVDEKYRQQGYAFLMIEKIKDYSRAVLQLHQIYCHIAKGNTASERLFAKSGFTLSGTLKDWQYNSINQKYEDASLMQIIL